MERTLKRGDVIFCRLIGEGSVQAKNRPCVIISNNMMNKYSPVIQVVPLTSQNKKDLITHAVLNDSNLDRQSTSLAEQITTIDREQIIKYLTTLNKDSMSKIDETIKLSFDLVHKNSEEEELKKSIKSLDYLISFTLSKGVKLINLTKEIRELNNKVNRYKELCGVIYNLKYKKYII